MIRLGGVPPHYRAKDEDREWQIEDGNGAMGTSRPILDLAGRDARLARPDGSASRPPQLSFVLFAGHFGVALRHRGFAR